MLYTLISFCLIIVILFILRGFKSYAPLLKEMSYLSLNHTNLLKGIATIMILISHIANYKGISILIPLGGTGVALFLISSGYGLNESFKSKGLHGFFKNRLLKLIIPYWIMVIMYWFINYDLLTSYSFFGSFLLMNRLPFMWFIQYIIICYALFYLSKKIFNDNKSLLFLFISGLLFIYIFKDNVWGEQSLSFTIGVALSHLGKIKSYLKVNKYEFLFVFFLLGVTLSSLFFFMKIKGIDTSSNYVIMNIVQMCMKISLAVLIMQLTYIFNNYLYTALITVGMYSFEIYLAHTLVIEMISSGQIHILIFFFVLFGFIAILIKRLSSKIFIFILEK